MSKITIKNIKQFIEGNSRMFLNQIGFEQPHIQEQISYRMLKCEDCMINKECKYCGCSVPGKLYTVLSCNNGERFPNLMSKPEWEQYKIQNEI